MGIGPHIVEAILREHHYRPIRGDVLMIGRQTTYFSPGDLLNLVRQHGISTEGIDAGALEIDRNTIDRLPGYEGRDLVTDTAIFQALGVPKIRALDVSPYEGAEVIHDLNLPVPDSLKGIADFIVDGSTLDNTFNPVLTLKNYADMLRPGGRMVTLNAFSSHDTPYAIMPPLWYLDYFVVNRFADCKAYVCATDERHWNAFWLDVDFLQRERRRMGRFVSPYHMVTVIFAEKGSDSTTDRIPIQQDYRSSEGWEIYAQNLTRVQKSDRPHLVRSYGELFVDNVIGGHMLVDGEFRLASPVLRHATPEPPQVELPASAPDIAELKDSPTIAVRDDGSADARECAQTELQALRAEIAALKASRSWRLTAPLRAVRRHLSPLPGLPGGRDNSG